MERKQERNNGLRLGIINAGAILNKIEEIVDWMERRKLDIIGPSEMRDKVSRITQIHGEYDFIGSAENSGKHGVGIIVREGLAQ